MPLWKELNIGEKGLEEIIILEYPLFQTDS